MSFASAMAERAAAPPNRALITFSIMASTLMVVLDTTIANVALPHMQGSLNASQDQVTWVLTSYIVASAILTPLTGWLAARFGRKTLFLVAVGGFTLSSALCGIATSIEEMVLFRLLQGVFGAPMLPLAQAVLLDINPREKHGQAMAIYGMGVMIGPIMGPVLGGWLTESYSWRWCFYINVPVGIVAATGILFSIHGDRHQNPPKLDLLGFLFMSLGLGALQMMLDRGQGEDWFRSREIWIEGALALLGFWWLAVQITTAERPFIDRTLLKDRNFVTATVLGFFLGVMVFSTTALLPPLMQRLLGYPVLQSGLTLAPRGIGTLISMFIVGRLVGRVDTRLLLAVAFGLNAVGVWMLTGLSLEADARLIIVSGVLQGIGLGLLFVPLSTIAFTTVPAELRTDASGIFTLVRNIGSAVGISIIGAFQLNSIEAARSTLGENIRPDNPTLSQLPAGFGIDSLPGLARMNGEVIRQASMIAYIDAFALTAILCIVCLPLLFLLRTPRRKPAPDEDAPHVVME